ncbi:isopenicillin N synthase family dioxygenase [Phenylobacterium montanum]|uniref:2-oxoglutarate-dependent ethylene/succinate-forming enzyme n=1 Tax=Phenylobacterium montanum TaxID=2823693 RepID=A0A975G220_9CAUL|nr:isopenicillin N synthase family oxygenase [Caulobacter sp. S6]QUD89122.1 isopenicillin N synthase family oxygenase [Caulobacter sp. S6]
MAPPSAFIPTIDIGAVRGGDTGALKAVGDQVRHAFTTSGFCYIRNHGVPDEVISAAASAALDFFHLPLEEKQKSAPKESVRGFNAIGRTTMYGAKNPDYKEYYQIGLELPRDDPAVLAGQPLRGPNQWPSGMPRFETALTRYFQEIGACGQGFLRAVAVSLGVAPSFFADKYDKPLQRTQCVYYPPHPADTGDELFGVAPHTDYGCVTLLWQDDVGGLEVQERSGAWVAAEPVPGTLVVNIGDLLARWSNDRYRSTPHRVTNRSGRERLSIATFYDPDYVAPVDPSHLGLGEGEAAKYAPVTAGDYIMGRINASQKKPQTLA